MIVKYEITYDLADDATPEEQEAGLEAAKEAGRVELAKTHDIVSTGGVILSG